MGIFYLYAVIAVCIAVYNIYRVAEEHRTKRHAADIAFDREQAQAEREERAQKRRDVLAAEQYGRNR